MTFLPWFLPRKEPPVQLREVGPNRGHLVIEIYSDVPLHLCRCRTGDKDCCGCSVGHRRQNITLYWRYLYSIEDVAEECLAAAPGVSAARVAAAVAAAAADVQ